LQLGIARDEYVEDHQQGDFLIRGIAGADPARGALVVGDVVPVGRTVRLQVRDADAADTDLRQMLQTFRTNSAMGETEGALLFSCNGRGAHLFGTADHDPALVRSALAPTGVAGCFAAGEIGPVAGHNFVHGFTASILAFGSAG
jgi:small ligand-binding sensory domain FIST